MLAVAGGAWALFGRDEKPTDASAIGPKVPTSAPTRPAFGPVAPGQTTPAAVTPTSTKPVAATAAATATSKPAPSKAPVATAAATTAPTKAPTGATAAPTKAPTVGPTAPKPVAKPSVTEPQQGGTVAKKDYTFKVARGDTLWELTEQILTDTGRPTLNATVAAHVAKFYQLNAKVIGSDPNLILPGQVLVWPAGL